MSSQGVLSSVPHRLTILLFQKLLSLGTLMTSKEKVSVCPFSLIVEVHVQQGAPTERQQDTVKGPYGYTVAFLVRTLIKVNIKSKL